MNTLSCCHAVQQLESGLTVNGWGTPTFCVPEKFGLTDFSNACDGHDLDCQTCGLSKNDADTRFRDAPFQACYEAYASFPNDSTLEQCLETAYIYYAAAAVGGAASC